jgi:hypothetical protein
LARDAVPTNPKWQRESLSELLAAKLKTQRKLQGAGAVVARKDRACLRHDPTLDQIEITLPEQSNP